MQWHASSASARPSAKRCYDEVSDAMDGVMLEVLAALGAIEKPEWNGEA